MNIGCTRTSPHHVMTTTACSSCILTDTGARRCTAYEFWNIALVVQLVWNRAEISHGVGNLPGCCLDPDKPQQCKTHCMSWPCPGKYPPPKTCCTLMQRSTDGAVSIKDFCLESKMGAYLNRCWTRASTSNKMTTA